MARYQFRVIIAIAILAALGLRVWWVRPVAIEAPTTLLSAQRRGNDYILRPAGRDGVRSLLAGDHLHGYHPRQHIEFTDALSERSGRFVRDGGHHHYTEFSLADGKMELHSELSDEGIGEWLEFLPNSLAVDEFFVTPVAMLLRASATKYSIYIPSEMDGTYMTVRVSRGLVERVVWMER